MAVLKSALAKAYAGCAALPPPSAPTVSATDVREDRRPTAVRAWLPWLREPMSSGLDRMSVPPEWTWPSLPDKLREAASAGFADLARLLRLRGQSAPLTVAIAGRHRHVGATSVLLALAAACREHGTARIALLDANWDAPALASRLGFSPTFDYWDVLAGRASPAAAGARLGDTGLCVFPLVQAVQSFPGEDRTADLANWLQILRQRFSLILVDAGAMSTLVPRAHLDRPLCDLAIEVATTGRLAEPAPAHERWRNLAGELLGTIETFTTACEPRRPTPDPHAFGPRVAAPAAAALWGGA